MSQISRGLGNPLDSKDPRQLFDGGIVPGGSDSSFSSGGLVRGRDEGEDQPQQTRSRRDNYVEAVTGGHLLPISLIRVAASLFCAVIIDCKALISTRPVFVCTETGIPLRRSLSLSGLLVALIEQALV